MAKTNESGTPYTLTFNNNSSQTNTVCVYQNDPDIGNPNVMSLAWFAEPAAPGTSITFTWSIDYSFVWDQTGTLKAGIQFNASEFTPADPMGANQVGLTVEQPSGAVAFGVPVVGPEQGTLYIVQDDTIPLNEISCGIGMNKSGVYAVQAEPNETAEFTPHPVYWITFGSYTQGEVLDVTTITAPGQILFPPNVYAMTASLGLDNTWTITQGA